VRPLTARKSTTTLANGVASIESESARSSAEQRYVEHPGQAVAACGPGARRRVFLAVARPHQLDAPATVLRGADEVGLRLWEARSICVSIADCPTSPSRNFDTSGKTAYLYFTQFHHRNCQQTLDRDLVRIPIQVR
jgi:hypothetical protein